MNNKQCICLLPEADKLPQLQLLRLIPHVTFGRTNCGQGAEAAIRAAERVLPLMGVCRRLVLERIGVDGHSLPEREVRVE